VAARYQPARDEVGGDWYDTIELPGGRLGVAIGDVVGHGLAAASLMGQLRTALRAYALNGNGPARALDLVDRFARSLDIEAMATAAYAVIDPGAGAVCVATAGHLPPVFISAGGEARTVELKPAPPLGAFGYRPCPEYELQIEPGETMLLYTDGLIERRGVPLRHSIGQLLATVAGATGPEEACLLAMDQLVPRRGPRDDVAVIAVRREPLADVLEIELPAEAGILARLRHQLGHWLRAAGLDREVTTEIMIAVSEAGANAVEHAYGPGRGSFEVRAARAGDTIEVTVRDRGRWREPRGENRGRGLKIMRAAMDSLDVRATEDGTEIVMRRKVGSP
jgi:anti-sigma regulatory factor (Ser/Thr protein kinase)